MSIVICRSHLSPGIPKFWEMRSEEALFSYMGGTTGPWRITKAVTHCGLPLKNATHVEITSGQNHRVPAGTAWVLSGVVRNSRYVTREERIPLESNQPSFSNEDATCAALIPIRKSMTWWNLGRNERREIREAGSESLTTVMKFLPAIARKLRPGRAWGEKFDSVTWFEYAPQDASIFDAMVDVLRSSEEWRYVEREIDIRLVRDPVS